MTRTRPSPPQGPPPDVHVVVREAGERTAAACRDLAAAEVGDANVTTIREVPFARALKAGLARGVTADRRWTLCLDADVLLRPGAISDLVAAADAIAREDPDHLGISGVVADKLLGQVRTAGNSLYRTRHLPQALEIGPFDAAKGRPETHLKHAMRRAGHPWRDIDTMVGLHDHEQAFADIFRKVFTHGRKHDRFMTYCERYWSRMAEDDADLRVALWSLKIFRMIDRYAPRPGTRRDESISIDLRGYAGTFDAVLIPAGMTEKPPLGDVADLDVGAMIAAFREAPEYLRDRPLAAAEAAGGLRARIARRRHQPVVGRLIHALAAALTRRPRVR